MSEAKIGAKVQYCGHDATFVADIFKIGNVNVVRASGPVKLDKLKRPAVNPTHRITDFPTGGFWRPDLGVFVVPEEQVVEVSQ